MRRVKFSVSTGLLGSERAMEYDLESLGINEQNFSTEKELLEAIEESYEEWLQDNIVATWDFVKQDK